MISIRRGFIPPPGAPAGTDVACGTFSWLVARVGEGIVRALLGDPSVERVIASSRDPAKLDALRRNAGANEARLTPIVGGLGNAVEAEGLRARVLAAGPLDAAIASLGGWWEGGPLLGVDEAAWNAALDEFLTT